jgi:hypothetical protein
MEPIKGMVRGKGVESSHFDGSYLEGREEAGEGEGIEVQIGEAKAGKKHWWSRSRRGSELVAA